MSIGGLAVSPLPPPLCHREAHRRLLCDDALPVPSSNTKVVCSLGQSPDQKEIAVESEQPYSAKMVGERIRLVRKSHGLSQTQFALRCGFSVTALSGWENGRQRPRIDFAEKIIDEFDLTLDYLLLGRMGTLRHSVAVHLTGLI